MSLRGGALGVRSSSVNSTAISAGLVSEAEEFCAGSSESCESGGMTRMLYRGEICRKNYLAAALTREKVYKSRGGYRAGHHRKCQPTRGDPAAPAQLTHVSQKITWGFKDRRKIHAIQRHDGGRHEFVVAAGFQIDDFRCHAPMLNAGERIFRAPFFARVRKSQLIFRRSSAQDQASAADSPCSPTVK